MFGVILVLIFCCIRTKYGEIRSISPYSVRVREDMDQNNSEYGHFWRSEVYITTKMVKNMMKSMVVMSLVMMQGLKNSVEQLIDKLIFWKKILYEIWIFHGKWKFFKLTVWKVFRIRSFFGSYFLHSDWILKFFAFFLNTFYTVSLRKNNHTIINPFMQNVQKWSNNAFISNTRLKLAKN